MLEAKTTRRTVFSSKVAGFQSPIGGWLWAPLNTTGSGVCQISESGITVVDNGTGIMVRRISAVGMKIWFF